METARKRIMFLDYVLHQDTNSARFFVELLSSRYDVECRYVGFRTDPNIPNFREVAKFDCIICWQVNPGNMKALSWGKPVIYVPMLDGETGNIVKWMRNRLQGIKVISFCSAETHLLEKVGYRPLEVKYYPKIGEVIHGDVNSAFLWNRGDVSESEAKSILSDKVNLVAYRGEPKAGEEPRHKYLEFMSQCGIYIAPRKLEGIGLSFLEAMAMGKCVIAHDAPTMSEYVAHEENGYLVDFNSKTNVSLALDAAKVAAIGCAAYESCVSGRRKWEEKYVPSILEFVESTMESQRPMTISEKIEWLALLPFHSLWDFKTLVCKICSRKQ